MKRHHIVAALILAAVLAVAAIPSGAEDSSAAGGVTAYLTLTDDGNFVQGNDAASTVMARAPVTADCFDLAPYDLGEFQPADGKPTLLHFFIRALERYYLGGGTLVLGTDAMEAGGDSGNLYMTKFWGHDENLIYFVDHAYPVVPGNPGQGATLDAIPLKEGMAVDVGMFSDWDFYHAGMFPSFDRDEIVAVEGESVSVTLRGTYLGGMGSSGAAPLDGQDLTVSRAPEELNERNPLGVSTDSRGNAVFSFPKAGTYWISAAIDWEGAYGHVSNSGVSPNAPSPVLTVTVSATVQKSISYDLNGGKGNAPAPGSASPGSSFPVPGCDATKTGFSFGGWNDGSATYMPGSSYVMGNADVIFGAVWIPAASTHRVEYLPGGGTGNVPSPFDAAEGTRFAVAACALEKAGYSFGGWNDGSETYKPGDRYLMGSTDVALTAQWVPETYVVTFVDASGARVAEREFTAETGSIDVPEVPAIEGKIGNWTSFDLGKFENQTVRPEYRDCGTVDAKGTQRYDAGPGNTASFVLLGEAETLIVSFSGERTLSFDRNAVSGLEGVMTVSFSLVSGPSGTVVTITVSDSGGRVSALGGKCEVAFPYELREGETAGGLYAIRDEATDAERLDVSYDSATRTASFATGHFSEFRIKCEDVSAGGDNTVIYAAIGVAAVLAAVGAALFLRRKPR